jgi:Flp pilus assembly protein TadG
MNRKTILHAVTTMLSPFRKSGEADASLPPAEDKLQRSCRLFRRNRRAAAAVEFAIVAPIFLLMVFGMIEYGRMVMVYQILTNASREGARSAVLDGATTDSVTTSVTAYLTQAMLTGATVTVAPNPPSNAEYGDPVTVTVSVPFNQVSWLPSPMYLGGKTLTSTTVMRRETTDN